MVTVAEFTVPSEAVPSGAIFESFPTLTVELERVVPTDDAIVPYAWVRGVDRLVADAVRESTDGE